MDRRVSLAVVLLAALASGCGDAVDTSANPPAASSLDPSPTAGIAVIGGGEHELEPGTYALDLSWHGEVGQSPMPNSLLTVPDGWYAAAAGASTRAPMVRTSRCNSGTSTRSTVILASGPARGSHRGPPSNDLVAAFVDQPLRNASAPRSVEVDGYAGAYLEWTVPAEQDFDECHAEQGDHYFESWTGRPGGGPTDRYQQAPGQLDRTWIVDVDGHRLVIDAFSMPESSTEDIAELLDVVRSIRFEREAGK